MVELKPGIFGILLDLKETFNFFSQFRNKQKLVLTHIWRNEVEV